MKYILLDEDNTVAEIIPEFDPVFPDVSIEQRYSADFISKLVSVQDDVTVEQNDLYNPETGEFSKPEVPDIPYYPESLDNLKAMKRNEIDTACKKAIIDGIDVELPSGTEHFSLEETDQINLTAALTMVEQGAPSYPYHSDGNLCRLYTADEIKAISAAAMSHKLYHTTYCNHLFNWIERAESIEEVKSIYYGVTLPDDLLANMTEILTNAQTV